MFKTPILLITFNRPSHNRKVLEVIRAQQPKQLFVFQDGARDYNDNDAIKCAEAPNVVKELVDWDCELKTYYSGVNLGCGVYGIPLAAYVKQIGKKAIHLGGTVQYLFGIKSKAFDNNNKLNYLSNEYWVYPNVNEVIKNSNLVEGGRYW